MMEDKNGLTKQLQILSVVNKNESKFKRALFVVVVLITLFSTLLSLSFSYKAYNNIQDIMVGKEKQTIENVSYETLTVSFENGSVLNCVNGQCNSVVVKISNEGEDTLMYSIGLIDIVGESGYYNYSVNSSEFNKSGVAPSNSEVIGAGLKIEAGQDVTYTIKLDNAVENPNDYRAKVKISIDEDNNSLLG